MEWCDAYDQDTMHFITEVRRFLGNEVAPHIGTYNRKSEYPKEIIKKMAGLGFMGAIIPARYGGYAEEDGRDELRDILLAREISYVDDGLHLARIANSSLATFPILYAGSEEQRLRLLPQIVSGEVKGCFGLSEPDAGSDARSLKTNFVKKGSNYILNGQKTWITNAEQASIIVVFAKGANGKISSFLIECNGPKLDYPGITVKKIPKKALRVSEFCDVFFDNVTIPSSMLLGDEDDGWRIAKETLMRGRKNIAAQAVGSAAYVLDGALNYVINLRSQFNRPVWENQGAQFHFSDGYAKLLAAWALIEKVVLQGANTEKALLLSSSAKLFATETAFTVAGEIMAYFGAQMFQDKEDTPLWLERLPGLLAARIYEGANNIQRIIIARELEKMI